MADVVIADLNALDRGALMARMAEELPEIRKRLGISLESLSGMTRMDIGKLKQVEAGTRAMKWSEFMSLLFVLWNNDIGRGLVESKGLFPKELKRAMSINRNAHAPVVGSLARDGLPDA